MGGQTIKQVDHTAIRANQMFIIGLLIFAFLLNWWPLVAFVGLVMVIGTLWPQAALFKRIYKNLLHPLDLMQPDVQFDNPEPHLFAQGVGAAFNAAAVIALLASAPVIGWSLVWVVIVLASINLFFGFCAGCFVYYQLNRLGVPGFSAAPIQE